MGSLVLIAATSLFGVGCKYEDPSKGYQGPVTTTSLGNDEDNGKDETVGCEEGDTRTCKVDLGTYGGVKSCFQGVSTCAGGEWGPCEEPRSDEDDTLAEGPPPAAPPPAHRDADGDLQVLYGNSTATPCFGNACDPSCQQFQQAPAGGISAPADTTPFEWKAGSLDDIPGGLLAKGMKEPCKSGLDCQFDQACKNPSSGTCAHSKCEADPSHGLTPGCDSCVDDICAQDPSCCETMVGGSCSHNLCQVGGPVKKTCDSCALTICSNPAHAYCCANNGQWNAACVARVGTVCGKTCNSGSWTQSCADKVETVCGALCPASGAVDPVSKGECVPWEPGAKNPSCNGKDLTIGIVCASSGATVLPVCNHGQSIAPAGIPIAIYPANSGKIPSTNPGAPTATYCFTQQVIPPGQCISVSNCGNLSGNKEIMINPPGLPSSIAECSNKNNWTISPSNPDACQPPTCNGGVCPPTYDPIQVEDVYEAVCPTGTHAQWGFFTYETTTPNDSFVAFSVAVSDTGDFTNVTDKSAAIANTALNTSFCGMGGPSPCPIDLYEMFGVPKNSYRYLRLRANLIPSSDSLSPPILNQWKITYSCPDAE